MTNLADLLSRVENIPDAPTSHWAITRERLRNLAPDLYQCVTGETP